MLTPTLFLSHGGGPSFFLRGGAFAAIDAVSPAAMHLRGLEASLRLPQRPTSLVVISAHWEGSDDAIGVFTRMNAKLPLLFDYSGFPPSTYELEWATPGAPAVADRACELLTTAGFTPLRNDTRGFDHGVFVPLLVAFPHADIPTVQISLHGGLSPSKHLALGRALAPLRSDGALIIGSGFATHNMRETNPASVSIEAWAVEFDAWLSRALLSRADFAPASSLARWAGSSGGPLPPGIPSRYSELASRLELAATAAPHFARAHPRTEHWLPLLVALGAADPGALGGSPSDDLVTAQQLISQIVMGTASLASFRFDSAGSACVSSMGGAFRQGAAEALVAPSGGVAIESK